VVPQVRGHPLSVGGEAVVVHDVAYATDGLAQLPPCGGDVVHERLASRRDSLGVARLGSVAHLPDGGSGDAPARRLDGLGIDGAKPVVVVEQRRQLARLPLGHGYICTQRLHDLDRGDLLVGVVLPDAPTLLAVAACS
jgi:hypothetical protein